MKNQLLCILLLGFFIGDAQSSTHNEIQHLLKFVENTKCKYNRNGTMHSGAEARVHIKKKYDYYIDEISTTEDFIEYSATKSKMSGKYYEIHCPNQAAIKSKLWLLKELEQFRAKQIN